MDLPIIGLAVNALVLGLRHGLDADHLCAIADITGSAGYGDSTGALRLSLWYVIGHAIVVATLAVMAIFVGSLLPPVIDETMSRIVGLSLVLLGAWLLKQAFTSQRMESRGALLLKLMGKSDWTYGKRTAFSVGVIHGIGAETGTQILLLATIGGTADRGVALLLLSAFLSGLLVSNTAFALLSSTGFNTASKFRIASSITATIAAACSLSLGFNMMRC